jgi:diguanylate cyclase (GGDEF)-like protein
VTVPILLDGELWGAVKAGSTQPGALPPDAEERLAAFAELVAQAVRNADEQQRLVEQATTDALTGLCNRHSFRGRVDSEAERARRHNGNFSLVLLDLDHFKRVNDTFGHDVGDRVLIEASERLQEQVRAEDLLARVGGEEFAWVLPEIDSTGAWLAAERAREAIAGRPFAGVGRVTASAGVCDFDAAGDAERLFRLADRALYHAKTHGRNLASRYTEAVADADVHLRRVRAEQSRTLAALRALARAIDAKDPATFHHSERVAELAEQLAFACGWPRDRAADLREAARLHDVGKIGVSESILLKPGALTAEEYDRVKQHATLSCQIAREVVNEEQASWILHHHERWDGDGYPAGLAGDDIPDGARLLAVADAWDAMTVARPYGVPLPPPDAFAECLNQDGRQFAPDAIAALRRVERSGALTTA